MRAPRPGPRAYAHTSGVVLVSPAYGFAGTLFCAMQLLALGWEWPNNEDSESDGEADYGEESSEDDVPPGEDAGGPRREMVIINLQRTPLDKHCTLRFHIECDAMMQMLMSELGLVVPDGGS